MTMLQSWKGWMIAAALGIAGAATGAAGSTVSRVPAGGLPVAAARVSGGLSSEEARMYAAVRNPRPGELGWQQIPWMVDLQKGIRTARDERRPLLLFVSADDPLEKC